MFKFTIRKLLLLTLVVGLIVGWGLRERQLQAKVDRAVEFHAKAWALEKAALDAGWKVEWYNETNEPLLVVTGRTTRRYPLTAAPPLD